MKKLFLLTFKLFFSLMVMGQSININNTLLRSFRPQTATLHQHLDLDKDGDPDLILISISDSIKAYWIDDDDDMTLEDMEGDQDNDCLIIDRNKDGIFAGPGDLSLDWCDSNGDGFADMQLVVENSNPHITGSWDWQSNYMWIIDDGENDQCFNYIDWEKLVLRAWDRTGASAFYEDYHGETLFLKAHIPSYRYQNLSFNWENPFLFFDPDKDGLSEMSIRFEDENLFLEKSLNNVDAMHTGKIDRAFVSFDLDNDNGPGNEFDFDMTIRFEGKGFDYSSQRQQFDNLKGLADAHHLFFDARWRQLDELVYTPRDSAWSFMFDKGSWKSCWLVFDEDDDCERWERVELYEPKNPFLIGMNKGGIDNNPQSDATGDRGEWDLDNSGKGNLYIGFDGKIHLYGAEKGYWRIDQDAASYQGWGGLYDTEYKRQQRGPKKFPTIAYEDSNDDGFFNLIKYDLDGDFQYETIFDLNALGLRTQERVFDSAELGPNGIKEIFSKATNENWKNALEALELAKRLNVNYQWYAFLLSPKSLNEKYRNAFWLQFYLFTDFLNFAEKKEDNRLKAELIRAYFSRDWSSIK